MSKLPKWPTVKDACFFIKVPSKKGNNMSQKSHPTDKLKTAVGKDKKHITKITAKPKSASASNSQQNDIAAKPAAPAPKATTARAPRPADKKSRKDSDEKPLKQVFILARPFVALGRYIRDSWREIRQVRWPNRKTTWKMTLAVLVYCAIFMIFILLLDTLFTFLFNLIIQK